MASRIIAVTPEQLERTATQIEGLASDYKSQYTKLYGETNAMQSTWNGKDNVAFTQRIAGFKDDFDRMYDLMNKYAAFLRDSAKKYRTTQDNVANEARGLRNNA